MEKNKEGNFYFIFFLYRQSVQTSCWGGGESSERQKYSSGEAELQSVKLSRAAAKAARCVCVCVRARPCLCTRVCYGDELPGCAPWTASRCLCSADSLRVNGGEAVPLDIDTQAAIPSGNHDDSLAGPPGGRRGARKARAEFGPFVLSGLVAVFHVSIVSQFCFSPFMTQVCTARPVEQANQ